MTGALRRSEVDGILTLTLNKPELRNPISDKDVLAAVVQAICHATADHEEAVNAFLEKRAPSFTAA
ncbi:hypothetical protein [Rhizorhapis suberifaciens]|uniref:1,4-dihydroxy-2-naphthoyl-CoA synthase n=1 Tax=Rhizorhapis suberifaciens TaxID=13656 RepID=A0A840HVJ3_9SPHN|nr:hypothetical protein [Rhizorhapis suberifaciens]MBB4641444.1 1,4-dihydroxy-2-naphthoyl-CoA synthase [Rhizorhapis suberifaciens]